MKYGKDYIDKDIHGIPLTKEESESRFGKEPDPRGGQQDKAQGLESIIGPFRQRIGELEKTNMELHAALDVANKNNTLVRSHCNRAELSEVVLKEQLAQLTEERDKIESIAEQQGELIQRHRNEFAALKSHPSPWRPVSEPPDDDGELVVVGTSGESTLQFGLISFRSRDPERTHWMPLSLLPPLPQPVDEFEKWLAEFNLASNGGESYRPMARAIWDSLNAAKQTKKEQTK